MPLFHNAWLASHWTDDEQHLRAIAEAPAALTRDAFHAALHRVTLALPERHDERPKGQE